MDGGSANPSIDDMRYATQVAPAYNPAATPAPSFMESLPTLDEASNYLANLPAQAQRFLTNPAAFTEMLTGKNPLPEQAGFAASATGLPAQNPNSLFTPAGMAYNKGYESGEPVSIAAMGVPALAPAGRFLGSAAADRIMAGKALVPGTNIEYLNPQIMSAVKEKGGNWAQNSVNRLDALKYPIQNVGNSKFDFIRDNTNPAKVAEHIAELQKVGYSPEQIREVQNEMAINKWIDSKIKPYIRNEMGTPTDPVLALHEQGISHIPDIGTEHFDPIYWIKEQRQKAGMPESGFAKSPQAKDWENRADQSIKNTPAQFIAPGSNNYSADLGVLAGKNPDATVHELSTNARRLGFEHLTDELKNSISHNSDLPTHLRLNPETLDKMTVPHAVKHVAKINKYRAEQMAQAAKEGLKDFPVVHEGDKGFKIHELKLPESLPEGWKQNSKGDWVSPEGNFTSRNPNYAKLDRALKNEGEQMGHCVGGYTDSVASGKSRIFSLRDEKGGAHATVEATPAKVDYVQKILNKFGNQDNFLNAYHKEINAGKIDPNIVDPYSWLDSIDPHNKIHIEQIKGKGNGAVSEKYRGYIKDWLNKEADKIGQVSDLHNVGLIDTQSTHSVITELKDMYGNDGMHLYNAAVEANPTGGARFMSREDIRKLVEPKKPEGHKNGGRIKMAEGGEPPKLTPFEQFKIDNAERIRQGQEDIANRNKYNPYKGSDRPVPTSKAGGSGGAGFTPGIMNPFNPDSPLNRKNGGKIPSIDEMKLTLIKNK
jgi:hypothetical protein